jgi:hypothetical protein
MTTPAIFIPTTETGQCNCGRHAILRYNGKDYDFICDECREYFHAGFNVEL